MKWVTPRTPGHRPHSLPVADRPLHRQGARVSVRLLRARSSGRPRRQAPFRRRARRRAELTSATGAASMPSSKSTGSARILGSRPLRPSCAAPTPIGTIQRRSPRGSSPFRWDCVTSRPTTTGGPLGRPPRGARGASPPGPAGTGRRGSAGGGGGRGGTPHRVPLTRPARTPATAPSRTSGRRSRPPPSARGTRRPSRAQRGRQHAADHGDGGHDDGARALAAGVDDGLGARHAALRSPRPRSRPA